MDAELSQPTSVFIIAVLIAVSLQLIAGRMRFPPILLWLLGGMALGPFGLHLLKVNSIEPALHALIELGLAIILFEGGLNLNLKALREHGWTVGKLVVIGPALTTLIGGVAAHTIAGLDWPLALLFGALVSVSGPTVILPIVRGMRLGHTLNHLLIGEAMLVDVIGAILAIVMLQVALTPEMPIQSVIQGLVIKAAVGMAIGFAGGRFLFWILSRPWLHDFELRSIITLASAWGFFLLADQLSSQAGLLAMLMMGATLQRLELPDIQKLRHFKGSLSMLLISLLFVLLAAHLDLGVVRASLPEGLLIFAILALVARPLIVIVSTFGGKLRWRETAYLAAMAPRGLVAAGITSLFAIILEGHGRPQTDLLTALVYIVIILSVVFYSLLAGALKKALKIAGGDERSVLIIGGGQLGAEIGRALGEDREVRFLDLNAEVIDNLKRSGYQAVRGNALDPLYMEIVHAEEIGVALIMTGSSDHNLLIARLACEDFHIPEVYVALQEGDQEKHAKLIRQLQLKRLFAKPYTFTYWNDQAYRKRLVYEIRKVEPGSGLIEQRMADVRIPHGVLPIAIIRGGETYIPHDDFVFREGDEIKMLLRPERIQEGEPLILPPTRNKHIVVSGQKTNAKG